MTTQPPGPLFVCGAERSGTSLMFALLASHPRLSMVRRSNMWRWFYGKFGDLRRPENLDAAIDALARYERIRPLEPDWARVRADLSAGEPTYGRLFDALHRHRAERVGRPRWGDKSLHSEYFAPAIYREFPTARVIHMVRDPRDRFASITNRYEEESKGIGASTGRWLSSVRAGRVNRRRFGDSRYLVLRYEDLAADPSATTRQVCEFIDEEFHDSMLTMTGAPEHRSGNSSFGDLAPNAISTRPIGRYRDTLSSSEIAFIQLAAHRAMSRHGYDIEPAGLHGRQRLRFAVGWAPSRLGRLALWSVRDRYERPRATVPDHRLKAEIR